MKHLAAVLISVASWIIAPIIFAIPFIIHESSVINIFNPNYYGGSFLYTVAVFWPLFILLANLSNVYINNKTLKIFVLLFIYLLQIIRLYCFFCVISYMVLALFLTLTFLYVASYVLINRIIRDGLLEKYKVKPSSAKIVVVVIYLFATALFTHVINNPWLY